MIVLLSYVFEAEIRLQLWEVMPVSSDSVARVKIKLVARKCNYATGVPFGHGYGAQLRLSHLNTSTWCNAMPLFHRSMETKQEVKARGDEGDRAHHDHVTFVLWSRAQLKLWSATSGNDIGFLVGRVHGYEKKDVLLQYFLIIVSFNSLTCAPPTEQVFGF